MTDGDTFTTHHRGHGIFLARGADPRRMMAEIAGKVDGYCRGKGGSMHIADMGLGHLGANAIVGGGIPHVIGAGIAYRNRREPRVSVAFFGDGAMQQGILYESMNMAALWRLPVVFCCVNNQYGMGTRVDRSAGRVAFDERARAFGLDGIVVDGLDVEAVREAGGRVVDAARDGRPGFVSLEVFRFFGHARMDKSPYRTDEEEAAGRARDPVAFARDRLEARGIADAPTLERIDAEVAREMDAALDHAVGAVPPAADVMFDDVYAPGEPRPVPVRERIAAVLSEAHR
jgi:pyruvate dehydrogenase E1 component alpha subunit